MLLLVVNQKELLGNDLLELIWVIDILNFLFPKVRWQYRQHKVTLYRGQWGQWKSGWFWWVSKASIPSLGLWFDLNFLQIPIFPNPKPKIHPKCPYPRGYISSTRYPPEGPRQWLRRDSLRGFSFDFVNRFLVFCNIDSNRGWGGSRPRQGSPRSPSRWTRCRRRRGASRRQCPLSRGADLILVLLKELLMQIFL